ncbi:MAG: hypothetical protein CSA55_00865 [Ilumatobacter coccineus]|uniref:HTH lysR-type domain-containing protein n=1 Tax=Ilumatobacter coccineus TaxID=467094 RepID=A0A2G6KHG7_9ACTN|nr:MAG: hypothetical protein CSA55_00865 [Ilumatobacter coccineus]
MLPLPDLSLRQLEYLVAVASLPTWAAAADQVGVTPSALSQGLAELERRVGVPLFETQGRRRVLRPSAQPVLDHARLVIGSTRDLMTWSERMNGAQTGRIRLGLIDVAATVYYSEVLRSFRRDHAEVELTLTVAPSSELLAGLVDGHHDLVVCVEPAQLPAGIEIEPVRDESLTVYAPLGIEIGDPATWGPWVLFPSSSHTRQQIEVALRDRGSSLQVAAESHQPNVLREMVRLGVGWTVLPAVQGPSASQANRGPQIVVRHLVTARRSGAVVDPAVISLARQIAEGADSALV